jgi:hypothetical protein
MTQPSDEMIERVAEALRENVFSIEGAARAAIAATGLVEENARLKALGDGLAEVLKVSTGVLCNIPPPRTRPLWMRMYNAMRDGFTALAAWETRDD